MVRQHGINGLGAHMEAWTRSVGADFGVDLAEGFRQYRHTPYPKAPVRGPARRPGSRRLAHRAAS